LYFPLSKLGKEGVNTAIIAIAARTRNGIEDLNFSLFIDFKFSGVCNV
jgi:hypothetical protein